MTRRLELLLTVAATAVALAFFASVPYWPREQMSNPLPGFLSSAAQALTPSNKAPLNGPSVLAALRPAPDLNLVLPEDIAVVVARRGINGETGPSTATGPRSSAGPRTA